MSKCSICLENNVNLLMNCTHGLCHQCVNNLQFGNTLDLCPICRKQQNINYKTFFPGTDDYYPIKINKWINEYKKKGITNTEKKWIESNWGKIGDMIENNNLELNKKYLILDDNRYFYGSNLGKNRDNTNEFIFDNCITLERFGQYYKCSPPTRSIKINQQVYTID